MQNRSRVAGLALALVALTGMGVGIAGPAEAAVGNCPSEDFCAWDANAWAGSPFLATSYHTYNGSINVTDNITSSVYNRRSTGGTYYGCGSNWLFTYQIAAFPTNTGIDLVGSDNNDIDFFTYEGGC